jgi:hypothetical protein
LHLCGASGVPEEGRTGVGGSHFPSPLAGEGGFAKRRRVRGRGLSLIAASRCVAPSSGSQRCEPPSPARGEGKRHRIIPDSNFKQPAQLRVPATVCARVLQRNSALER